MSAITPALTPAVPNGKTVPNAGVFTQAGVSWQALSFGVAYSLLQASTNYRFEVINGQNYTPLPDPAWVMRSEVYGPGFPFNTRVTFAFGLLVRSTTLPTNNWEIFGQIHADNSVSGASPPFAFDLRPDGVGGMKLQFDLNYNTGSGTVFTNIGSVPFTYNTLYNLQVVFSDSKGAAAGYVQVTVNGTVVATYNGPTGYSTATAQSYPKWGIYSGGNGSVFNQLPLPGQDIVAEYYNPTFTIAASGSAWADLQIGGGGYCTGIDVAADGTLVTRVDVYGAYKGSTALGTAWTPLLNQSAFPAPLGTQPFWGAGVEEIRVAWSNSSVMYMLYAPVTGANGGWWHTSNGGATWTLISSGVASNPNNTATKTRGQKCAIDPANPNVAYLGNTNLGHLQLTIDGATVTNVSTAIIPAPSSGQGYSGLAFNAASGTTGGRTNEIMIPVYGVGAWRSTNAGVTFTQSAGAPTTITYGGYGPDGTYFCCDNSGNAWNYLSGTWHEIYTGHFPANAIAVDPFSAGHVAVVYAGYPSTTTNGNTATPTWTYGDGDPATIAISSPDVPWLQNSNDKFLSVGGLLFDPAVSGRCWFSQGTSVMYANALNANPGVTTWISQALRLENLVTTDICWPPGSNPTLVSWDRSFWPITNANAPAVQYGPNYSAEIRLGTAADWAKSQPTFSVGISSTDNNGTLQIFKNPSSGAYNAWSLIGAQPATGTLGGQIACASPTSWVYIDQNSGHVYQTQNGGASWTQPPTLPATGWTGGYFLCRHVVVADDTNLGTFYAYNGSNGSAPGVYRSTDSGVTWTRVFSGNLGTPADVFNACMRQAPGNAGHLFYTNGTQGGPTSTHPTGAPQGSFFRSTDGGATWTTIANMLEVWAFAFSAPKPGGGGYPSILALGWLSGVWGAWQSDDIGVSWTNLGGFPLGGMDQIRIAAGDPQNYGRWIVGGQGSSWKYYGPGDI